MRSLFYQVDFSDATKIADVFLQLSSVYKEDAEVKQAVLEISGTKQVLYSKMKFFLL